MDVTIADRSPCIARPDDPRLPAGLHHPRPARDLPWRRAALRMLALAVALCAVAALVSGSTQAGGSRVASAPLAPLPVILLPGGSAAAMVPISITCPRDITAYASTGSCSRSIEWAAEATPATGCKLLGIAYRIGSTQVSSPHTFPVGTTTVEAGAADSCQNTATCTFRVIVLDGQPPTITCPANVTVNADSTHCTASVSFAASASDNCSVASLTYRIGSTQISSPYAFPVGTTTVTTEARDPSGNSASCTFQVTVRDVTPPAIICPASITTNASPGLCSAAVSYAATASDACGVALTCTPAGGGAFPVGTTNVTCTARDPSNNSASCMFQVTVRDVVPPAITCPANVSTSNSPGQCSAAVSYSAPPVTDNCSATTTCTPASGSAFPVGTTNVTCTARDPSNNSASCMFQVTVRDTEPPTITCPANRTVTADSGRCAAYTGVVTPTMRDNCGVASFGYYVAGSRISNPYDFPVGTTTVEGRATDSAGNAASCTFQLTVREALPPNITCPANVTTPADSGRCSAGVSFAATAGDNCGVTSLRFFRGMTSTTEISSPYVFPVGATTVRAEARDASDNAAFCTFEVTVRDTQPPSISCPPQRVVQTDAGRCSASVSLGATASDNCAVDSLRYFWGSTEIGSPFTFSLGTTTVRAEARDAAGNLATCTFPVIVSDAQPPALSCPPDKSVNTDAGRCSATVPFTATATDNCGVAWLRYYTGTTEIRSPYTFTLGTATVRAVASDTVNTAECSFHVTVRDSERPTITCPPTVRVAPDPGQSYASQVAVGTATATDPCGAPAVSAVRADGRGLAEPYPLGRTVITWTARDAANNSTSCTQEVWVASGPPSLYLPCLLRQ